MSDLLRDPAPGSYGGEIELPIVYSGSFVYVPIVSNTFKLEEEVSPVTVRVSGARAPASISGIGAGRSADWFTGAAPTFVPDQEFRTIYAVVEWYRGNAKYAMECDPGALFVLDATSINVTARIEFSKSVRKMSASLTKGAHPGPLRPPTFTTRPIGLTRAAAPALLPANRIYIPPFAETVRVTSLGNAGGLTGRSAPAVCIYGFDNLGGDGSGAIQLCEPIWVTSWMQEIELPSTGANCMYVMPASGTATVVCRFNLAP